MREFNYNINSLIKERWSPRAFSKEKVDHEDLMTILEAARFAPSCFNEQPWRYMVATEHNGLDVFQSFLLEKNYLWAKEAPVLILLLSKNTFAHNDKENKYANFDTGTSWGFLSLEAKRLGYDTHAMAGIKKKEIRDTLSIPENYDIICMIALGKYGNKESLPDALKNNESPNVRKKLDAIIYDYKEFGSNE
jgi:nitroreductase